MSTKLTIGFSPCPNDCFIFDAMIHSRIDTEGLEFDVVMEDVETLNNKAFQQQLDITKLSFHALLYLTKPYILLKSGSALGFNCGPVLIKRSDSEIKDINAAKVAIPGKYTTANFLLSLAFPDLKNKEEVVFSDIERSVIEGKCDAGLIIHESRFTYEEKGLEKIIDLGEFWEKLIHAPIPLGGIVTRRSFDMSLQQKINRCIKRSVEFAFKNREVVMPYVKQHAQEMNEGVMQKHIQLYVNEFSVDLGETGEKAVEILFDKATEAKMINNIELPIIIN